MLRWQAAGREWDEVLTPENSGNRPMTFGLFGSLLGPVYDPRGERILAVDKPLPQFNRMHQPSALLIGKPGQNWRRSRGAGRARR